MTGDESGDSKKNEAKSVSVVDAEKPEVQKTERKRKKKGHLRRFRDSWRRTSPIVRLGIGITTLAALAACATAIIAERSRLVSERLAEATEKSNLIATANLLKDRAWLGGELVGTEPGPFSCDPNKQVVLNFQWQNYGKYPAVNIKVSTLVIWTANWIPFDAFETCNCVTESWPRGIPIAQTMCEPAYIPETPVGACEPIVDGLQRFAVLQDVRYSDVIDSKVRHRSEVCYFFDTASPTGWTPCDSNNRME